VHDQPPRDEARVLPRLEHAGEVVQRGVDVGPADALDEAADDVVVLVAVAVVADGGPVDRLLQQLQGDPVGGARGGLQGGERPPRVAPGQPHQVVLGVVVELDRAGQPALVGQRPRTRPRTSSSVSGSRVSSSERDSSGEMTLKNGFSVVAATSVTQRFSTLGSSASCWVLEKRCTSSTNSTVWAPVSPSARRASSTTCRTSLTPAVTALSSRNRRRVELAMT
jgi:hypothetical protein